MRKLNFFIAATTLFCVFFCGNSNVPSTRADAESGQYYLGGMTAGFLLSAGGAEVIELSEIVTENGIYRPAADAGVKAGDCICAIDDVAINSIKDLNNALNRSGGKEVKLLLKRNGETAEIHLCPVKEKKSGNYKIGVLIRDTMSGIGTVTYIEKYSWQFAALGHNITDENNNALKISDSKVYLCSVIGVNKGVRGKAGELRGLFINDKPLATAETVCSTGLYGTFNKSYDFSHSETVGIAPLSDACIGKAVIYSTIDGTCPQQYEISIAKVEANNKDNKNFVIKVTDKKLIAETGGIVQGMSGSPIVQNGKLIGAVTHVFLNDPTRGYGIGIEKMITAASGN